MKRVVVTQPYFFPYAGYFRLLMAADEFVLFDCVQFPRRGRVHRCDVPGPDGRPQWLTLPLLHQARETRICDLRFAKDARAEFDARLRRLPWVRGARGDNADAIRKYLHAPMTHPVDYLEAGLRLVASLLSLTCRISRSSTLSISPSVRAQDRVMAVVRAVGGTHYINAPSGRNLYKAQFFAENGLELKFLRPYQGCYFQMLPALMSEEAAAIRQDILEQTHLEAA